MAQQSREAVHMHEVLGELLPRAGQEALRRFRQVRAERKADGSRVTEADRAVERVLLAGIRGAFPDDGVTGEEGAAHPGTTGRVWYLDPIDGTSAFLEGLPTWCVTVCLVQDEAVVAGATWFPRLDELWLAVGGQGAWRDGHPLEPTEGCPVLYVPSGAHRHLRVDFAGKVRNLGSIAAHLALVAGGAAQAALVGPGWRPWDVGAGLVLLAETGGVARTLDGAPLALEAPGGPPFLAGRPDVVAGLLQPGRLVPHTPIARELAVRVAAQSPR